MVPPRAAVVLLAAAVLAGGCGARAPHRPTRDPAPALVVTVFDDGFHSGLILPYADAPTALDAQRGEATAPLPFVEIGFGEARWMQDIDRGWVHAVRIALWPSDGMLMLVNLPERRRPDRDRTPTRYWQVPVTAAGGRALFARIERWIDRSKRYVRPPDDPLFFFAGSRNYTPFRDCHDFTIDLLRAARFPIERRWLATAGGFDRGMDSGMAALAEAGIAAVGP